MVKSQPSVPQDEDKPGASFQPVEQLVISTPEQLKAISDPLRLKIIELIFNEALTVKQIAVRLDQPPTKLYYHVAELEEAGFVAQVDTRVKSGIIEKYYRTSALNVTVDHKLLNGAASEEGGMPELLQMVFETTSQELKQSIMAGLIRMDDESADRTSNIILARTLIHIRSENVAQFVEKFKNLLLELSAEESQAGPAALSYGCLVTFYPRFEA